MQMCNVDALQAHPGLVKGTGKSKEGFSVVALLDRTVSAPGRRALYSWCRQPSLDREIIRHRQDAGEEVVSLYN